MEVGEMEAGEMEVGRVEPSNEDEKWTQPGEVAVVGTCGM